MSLRDSPLEGGRALGLVVGILAGGAAIDVFQGLGPVVRGGGLALGIGVGVATGLAVSAYVE